MKQLSGAFLGVQSGLDKKPAYDHFLDRFSVSLIVRAGGMSDSIGILRRLRRRKAWICGTFVLLMTLAGVTLVSLPNSYRATASVVIADNGSLVDTQTPAQAARTGDPADLESQILVLRSTKLLKLLLQRPEIRTQLLAECDQARTSSWLQSLKTKYLQPVDCEEMLKEPRSMMDRLEAGFAVGTVGRSRVIEVSFISPNLTTPAVMTNALVELYLEQDLARKIDTRSEAAAWLRGELERTGDDLRRSEMAIEAYRHEHGIIRGEQASISSERLSALNAQLVQAEAAAALAASRLQGNIDAREVLDSRTIADLRQQLTIAASQRAEIISRYSMEHPAAVAATRRVDQIEEQIGAERRRILNSVQRDLLSAETRVEDLRRQVEAVKTEVAQADSATAAMATLVRNVEVKRELFVDLSKRLSTMETERRLVSGDARLIGTAQAPTKPWFPKRAPFMVVATILSLIASIMVAILRDRADRRLRSVDLMSSHARVPLLGHVPRIGRRRAPLPMAWKLDHPSDLQDAIRSIYARTLLTTDAHRTLLVTSAGPGEGKTFLTLALGQFSANARLRVLIIECDLRRPSFRETLSLPSTLGLSEYLRGAVPLNEVMNRATAGKPDIIHAGAPSVDSTELLSSERFNDLLKEVHSRYDLILLDSPPALLLPDARILAPNTDGVVICASWAQTQMDMVTRCIEDLRDVDANILGLVVGMVQQGSYSPYGPATQRVSVYSPGALIN